MPDYSADVLQDAQPPLLLAQLLRHSTSGASPCRVARNAFRLSGLTSHPPDTSSPISSLRRNNMRMAVGVVFRAVAASSTVRFSMMNSLAQLESAHIKAHRDDSLRASLLAMETRRRVPFFNHLLSIKWANPAGESPISSPASFCTSSSTAASSFFLQARGSCSTP